MADNDIPVRLHCFVPFKRKQQLQRLAQAMSQPGAAVSVSECVNEAIQDYLDKHAGKLAGGRS